VRWRTCSAEEVNSARTPSGARTCGGDVPFIRLTATARSMSTSLCPPAPALQPNVTAVLSSAAMSTSSGPGVTSIARRIAGPVEIYWRCNLSRNPDADGVRRASNTLCRIDLLNATTGDPRTWPPAAVSDEITSGRFQCVRSILRFSRPKRAGSRRKGRWQERFQRGIHPHFGSAFVGSAAVISSPLLAQPPVRARSG
jgi:hypothetical protein